MRKVVVFVLVLFNVGAIKGWPDTALFNTPFSAEISNVEDIGEIVGAGAGDGDSGSEEALRGWQVVVDDEVV